MSQGSRNQVDRILSMYDRLKNGETLVKKEEANRFKISEKSIQRDLENLKSYFANENRNEKLYYNREKQGYILESGQQSSLRNEEIFAVLKVLVESRAFPKYEMDSILEKLMNLAPKEGSAAIEQMMSNEKYLYVELNHKKDLLNKLWQLSMAIQSRKVINIHYKREFDEKANERKIKPVGIIFSEYYFYLIAYQVGKDFEYPTIYRIDRIEHFDQMSIPFKVPYQDRFQEGEFRKRVQFMYTGELINVKFKFTGPSPQAVLDRLPTAKVIEKLDDGLIFEAEVFGKGIKMWLLSQGEYVEVLQPLDFKSEFIEGIKLNLNMYDYIKGE